MILVVNVGLKNSRCIVFNSNGKELFNKSTPIKTIIKNNFVEQSVKEIEKKTFSIFLEATKKFKNKINHITVTTSSCCLVCLDNKNKPLMNSIIVSDSRSAKECNEINKLLTNFKNDDKCRPDLMLPKIIWIRNNKKKIFNQTSKFLNIGDYLSYKITGHFFTDKYNASKFFLDKTENKYFKKIYDKYNININKLPKIYNNKIFEINKKFIKKFSLRKNCQFVQTSYDAISSMLGCGATSSGELGDMSGTVSNIRILTSKKPYIRNKILHTFFHPFEKLYIVGGSNNLGGGIIEWIKNAFFSKNEFKYSYFDKLSSQNFYGLIFLPYLMGERAPIWDSKIRGIFFGLSKDHEKKDLIVSILVGMAYSLRNMVDAIETNNKSKIKKIFVSGGLSRINIINQLKADITGRTVIQLNNHETTSIGSAIWVEKIVNNTQLKKLQKKYIKIKKIYKPNKASFKKHNDFYRIFRKLNFTLQETQHQNYEFKSRINQKKSILHNL